MRPTTTVTGSTVRRSSSWLLRADRVFRLFGKLTLALLLATAGLIAADLAAWRGVFASAHLVALIALMPLGIALIVDAFRDAGAEDGQAEGGLRVVGEVVRRHRVVTVLLAIALVTVVLSLANFEGGDRLVRRAANLTTVGIVLVLVWRYHVWSRGDLTQR